MKTVLMILAGLLLLTVLAALSWLHSISKPSRGLSIAAYKVPLRALLILDLQEDTTGSKPKISPTYPDTQPVINAVNQAIQAAELVGMPVVTLRQEFRGFPGVLFAKLFVNGATIEGRPGCELDRRIVVAANHDFTKPIGDAFSNPEFERYLITNQINELVFMGADAEFCVHLTAQAALNRGYRVGVIQDGLLLRAKEKWQDIMQEYRREGISLFTLEEFMAGIRSQS